MLPRANGRTENNPERVYLWTEKPSNWKDIAVAFKESGGEEPYVLLSIDRSKMNENIKFYFDSNTFSQYPVAVYTLEPIPPYAITIIESE